MTRSKLIWVNCAVIDWLRWHFITKPYLRRLRAMQAEGDDLLWLVEEYREHASP